MSNFANFNAQNEEGMEFFVKFTKRYDLFSKVPGNRDVNGGHLIQLTKSMRTNGSLITPILVNEKMEVIDGQHRLEALKELKREVPFIQVSGYGPREMQVMNQQQKNWRHPDFLHYYTKQKKDAYVMLTNFMIEFPKIQLSAAVYLLSPNKGTNTTIELDR